LAVTRDIILASAAVQSIFGIGGAFANLRSGFGGGIDQQLVEDGALRTVRNWSF
jgi:hypothetical protein